jgi:ABC-type amino acid transport substrate-binding protein
MSGRRFRFPPLFLYLLALFALLAQPAHALSTVEAIKARGVLLWGCDISGGAPLAFVNPKDPSKLLGFEAEIAEAIARELGVVAGGPDGLGQPGSRSGAQEL